MNLKKWEDIKHVLIVRLDNMGDVLMSEPAIRAVRSTFRCKITLLTSSAGKAIAGSVACIDQVIEYNVPWVKADVTHHEKKFFEMVATLKSMEFDAAVILTVFSQNPLPAAMIVWLAGIPRRLAYCRENPYELLTDWLPEKEPFDYVRHQVKRDLDLVEAVGAFTDDDSIHVEIDNESRRSMLTKLHNAGIKDTSYLVLLHPGVSEEKRKYPLKNWIEIAKQLADQEFTPVVTGSQTEVELAQAISAASSSINLAGELTLTEFIALVDHAAVVVSVNTATIHIAAATKTSVVVLYALSNPQHTPWRGRGVILPYSIPAERKSKNEVLRYVDREYFQEFVPFPSPSEVRDAVSRVLTHRRLPVISEVVSSQRLTLSPTESIRGSI